jgi:hypothetical protein
MSTVLHPAGEPAREHSIDAPHPVPRADAVLREQFRAVGVSARGEMLAAAVLMLGVTVLMALYHVNWGSGQFEMLDMRLPLVGVGLFAPLAVWKNESPSRRAYLWALPVARSRNSLARVLGGWTWVMLLCAGLMLWTLGITLVANGGLGAQDAPYGQPWMWLLPFTGATVAYLAGSAIVLATDHPWRWTAAAVFLFAVLLQLAEAMRALWFERLLGSVVFGRYYGLNTVATGRVVVRTLAPDGAVDFRMVPDQQAWVVATLIWGVIALVAVLAAAHRYQES